VELNVANGKCIVCQWRAKNKLNFMVKNYNSHSDFNQIDYL